MQHPQQRALGANDHLRQRHRKILRDLVRRVRLYPSKQLGSQGHAGLVVLCRRRRLLVGANAPRIPVEVFLDVLDTGTHGTLGFLHRAIAVLATLARKKLPLAFRLEEVQPLLLQVQHVVVIDGVVYQHCKTSVTQRFGEFLWRIRRTVINDFDVHVPTLCPSATC